MSLYHCQCLCDSENFFLFEGGQIIRYSDKHVTQFGAGSYEALGDGTYQVTLASRPSPGAEWIVRPGRRSWVAPGDQGEPWFRRYLRRFYRPHTEARARELIATAVERDRITAGKEGQSAASER